MPLSSGVQERLFRRLLAARGEGGGEIITVIIEVKKEKEHY
jgi:hypothetical protein